MRYRLSTLLMLVTIVAVAVALGHRVYVLEAQVRDLSKQVKQFTSGAGYQFAVPAQNTSPIGVPWSVERAMLHEGYQKSRQNQLPPDVRLLPNYSPSAPKLDR